MIKKNRTWIWFFLALIGLSLVAVVTLIVYNLGQQLKPEELTAARRLWQEHGPRGYQLTYTIKRGIQAKRDTFVVRVRAGRVVSASVNDLPEPKERFPYRGMDALFDNIARFQDFDAKPGRPRTYTRAIFDKNTGALLWYVRTVMGGQERVEILVDPLESLREPESRYHPPQSQARPAFWAWPFGIE